MSNPIFTSAMPANSNNQRNSAPKSLFAMFNQIRNSPNPDQAMQRLLSNDPQYQGIMQYINQNGGDAKSAFYNMAAQKGVDPNSILSQLR